MRRSFLLSAMASVAVFAFSLLSVASPAHAVRGERVVVYKSDVVINGATNINQIRIDFLTMPDGGRIQILLSGATYASTAGMAGSNAFGQITITNQPSVYTSCGTTGISFATYQSSGSFNAICRTSGGYIEWEPPSLTNYGGKLSIILDPGALSFTSSTVTGTSYINGNRTYGDNLYDFTLTARTDSVVTFNPNGGTGTAYTQRASTPTNLTANTFTRSGYRFMGWGAGQTTSVTYTDGASYNFGPTTADSNFYAIWQMSTPQPAISVSSTSGTFGTPITLTTSGGAGTGALSYSVSNGTASGCSISNGILSSTSAGTCTVTATKAADTTYDSATSAATIVTFNKASRTLSFGATTSYTLAYGATQTVVATPSAGAGNGTLSYSVSSGSACTVDASTGIITVTASSGSCVVSASITEGSNYLAATTSTQVTVNGTLRTITVTGGSPSINFGTTPTPTALVTTGSLVGVQTVDHSQTTFTFQGINGTVYGPSTVVPQNAGQYSVLPSNLAITGGSASDYNITYSPGTLSIAKVARTLSFGSTTSYSLSYGATQTVLATPSAGDGTVTYSAGSSTACSVNSSGVISITAGSGTCAVSASITGGTNHLDASTTTSVTITVSRRALTLTAGSPSVTVGGSVSATFSLTSGTLVGSDEISTVTYTYSGFGSTTYAASTTAPTAIGTYSLTPSAAVFSTGTSANYTIAYVAGTLTIVNKTARTISFAVTNYNLMYGETQSVTATPSLAPNDGSITYSEGSSTACSVDSSGLITVTAPTGTCDVTATISEGTYNLAATTATPVTVVVSARTLSIKAADITVPFGAAVTPAHSISNGTLVGSDNISSVSFTYAGTGSTTYAMSTTVPTASGTYSVTPLGAQFSTGSASNYAITYVAGTLTIGAAPSTAGTSSQTSTPQSTSSRGTSSAKTSTTKSPKAGAAASQSSTTGDTLAKTGSSSESFMQIAAFLLLIGAALLGTRFATRRR